jgi:hypothetical protein
MEGALFSEVFNSGGTLLVSAKNILAFCCGSRPCVL